MDAVIGTLVLCSVKDVNLTLQGSRFPVLVFSIILISIWFFI